MLCLWFSHTTFMYIVLIVAIGTSESLQGLKCFYAVVDIVYILLQSDRKCLPLNAIETKKNR